MNDSSIPVDRRTVLKTTAAVGTAAAIGTATTGTVAADDPIEVSTPEELDGIRNAPGADHVLVDDIDLSDWGDWKAIEEFSGHFDGQEHTISNLTSEEESLCGLFELSEGAVVENLLMDNAHVDGSWSNGCVAGQEDTGTLIQNVIVKNSFVGDGEVCGGIAGSDAGSTEVRDCLVIDTTIEVSKEGGGIKGLGSVTEGETPSVHSCEFEGEIVTTGDNATIGGIVGADDYGGVSESKATVDITIDHPGATVGGVCGSSEDDPVHDSYATGTIEDTTNEAAIGAIIGSDGPLSEVDGEDLFSAVEIIGGGTVKGVVAEIGEEEAYIHDCYWNSENAGTEESGLEGVDPASNHTPLTTDEMQGENAPENMDTLDFEETWETTESYPTISGVGVEDRWDVEEEEDEEEKGGDGDDDDDDDGWFSGWFSPAGDEESEAECDGFYINFFDWCVTLPF